MKKIINPVMCDVYGGRARGFVKIEFENERLSISGVIGSKKNGNCMGICGQCVEEIRQGEPVEGWTKEMIQRLCDIWDEWHLNDMRPYCQHQKELGWDKLASKTATLYNYELTQEAYRKQEAAKRAAIQALKNGETFTPSAEQVKYASLPYSITTPVEISGEDAMNYEPKKPLYSGDKGPTKVKMLGWLKPDEHPDGILGKPCPVCGYEYGHSWNMEKVPEDVIKWLFSLPDTAVQPAWI